MKKFDVIVIGAGASGLLSAGKAGEQGKKVLLLEKKERAGRKILISGKGRCNITNKAYMSGFFKHIHPNGKFLKFAFSRFFSKDIISLLSHFGVDTKVERGGRIFPESDNAHDVVNALLLYAKRNNVQIRYKSRVADLITEKKIIKGVKIVCSQKIETIFADKIILCTGGMSYPATGSTGDGYKFAKSLGHSITKVRPALVPIETKGDIAKKLQGLSLKNVNASVWIDNKKYSEMFGEMLFTHFGLSGPIILSLSRFIVSELQNKKQLEISIDLKPALDSKKLDKRLIRDLNENGKKQIANIFKLWLPSKLIPVFIEQTGINISKKCCLLDSKERKKIRILMKDFRLKISGYRPFKEAIITAGGISTKEINSRTMESKLVKGLFFAGEVIDLDADTGGYNLQIAFSTGNLAGS